MNDEYTYLEEAVRQCTLSIRYPAVLGFLLSVEPASEVNSVLLMWAVVAALIVGHLQGTPWAVEDLLDLP